MIFISRFGFKSGVFLLIAPVPVHSFSITFLIVLKLTFFFVTQATNQISDLEKIVQNMKDYSINISVKKSDICNETAETVNFHFFNYKSMEIISCHSNQSSYPTGTKHTYSFPIPIDAICEI